MTKVRLYLDIDDTINCKMPQGWGKLEEGYAAYRNEAYRLRWAPKLIEELNNLDVEIVWTTTWEEYSDNVAELVGLPKGLRVIERHRRLSDYMSIDWKRRSIQYEQHDSPSPFIWAENETTQYDVDMWSSALVLLLNPLVGITPKDVEAMKNYIEENKDAA